MMNKTELIDRMASHAPKETVSKILNTLIDTVVANDKTVITGFGTFEWRNHPARKARNPKTGEPVDVPERKTLHFKPSSSIKSL